MTLKEALMRSQDLSETDADAKIAEMANRFLEGESAFTVLEDEGLEDDYMEDLLDNCS